MRNNSSTPIRDKLFWVEIQMGDHPHWGFDRLSSIVNTRLQEIFREPIVAIANDPSPERIPERYRQTVLGTDQTPENEAKRLEVIAMPNVPPSVLLMLLDDPSHTVMRAMLDKLRAIRASPEYIWALDPAEYEALLLLGRLSESYRKLLGKPDFKASILASIAWTKKIYLAPEKARKDYRSRKIPKPASPRSPLIPSDKDYKELRDALKEEGYIN